MLLNALRPILVSDPIRLRVGEREFVGLEARDYELVERRLSSFEMLLALFRALVPDLEQRIQSVEASNLLERVEQLASKNRPASQKANEVLGMSALKQAKMNLKAGGFTSLEGFKKQVAVEEIRDARERAGITQQELAQKAGLSQPQLSRLEKNPRRASVANLRKVASALEIELVL